MGSRATSARSVARTADNRLGRSELSVTRADPSGVVNHSTRGRQLRNETVAIRYGILPNSFLEGEANLPVLCNITYCWLDDQGTTHGSSICQMPLNWALGGSGEALHMWVEGELFVNPCVLLKLHVFAPKR